MKYKNKITGLEISIPSVLSGGGWELIPEAEKKEKPKGKGRPKKGSENTTQNDEPKNGNVNEGENDTDGEE